MIASAQIKTLIFIYAAKILVQQVAPIKNIGVTKLHLQQHPWESINYS